MRDWLTVIIVLLIVGIVLDGIRRMRAYRRDALRMSRKLPDADDIPEAHSSSEFPSGGARVAGYRDPKDVSSVNQNLRESYVASRQTRGAPSRAPEQGSLGLDIPVPMLMDSVMDADEDAEGEAGERSYGEYRSVAERSAVETSNQQGEQWGEPSLGNLDDLDDDLEADRREGKIDSTSSFEADERFEERFKEEAEEELNDASLSASAKPNHDDDDFFGRDDRPKYQSPLKEEDQPKAEPKKHSTKEERRAEKAAAKAAKQEPSEADAPRSPDEVLIISVMARKGELFQGNALLQAVVNAGLRYGDMDIFHRHESEDGNGSVLYSLANMVVPGTFNLSEMDEFTTPGISLFLTLPINGDSLQAYNLMAASAQSIAEALEGELKDENRSVMTKQTIEHGRQRVMEYERKRHLARV